jgi:hypothetical protein
MSHALSGRVLVRLERAELHEPNPHFQDDYRIAWLTVLYASRDVADPHVQATAKLLGIHPDKVWKKMDAQRRATLGADYEKFFGASSPKKPVQSERSLDWKKPGRDAA